MENKDTLKNDDINVNEIDFNATDEVKKMEDREDAYIDPQKVKGQSIDKINLENPKFISSFDGVDVSEIEFKTADEVKKMKDGEDAYIDPQKVKEQSIDKVNLENLKENLKFISSFDGVDVSEIEFKTADKINNSEINEDTNSAPKFRR